MNDLLLLLSVFLNLVSNWSPSGLHMVLNSSPTGLQLAFNWPSYGLRPIGLQLVFLQLAFKWAWTVSIFGGLQLAFKWASNGLQLAFIRAPTHLQLTFNRAWVNTSSRRSASHSVHKARIRLV